MPRCGGGLRSAERCLVFDYVISSLYIAVLTIFCNAIQKKEVNFLSRMDCTVLYYHDIGDELLIVHRTALARLLACQMFELFADNVRCITNIN